MMGILSLTRERVYDPVLRLIHAWNGFLILLLLASGQGADYIDPATLGFSLRSLHLLFGYGLLLGLVARLIWGVVGPPHATWRAMWHPQAWLAAWRQRRIFVAPMHFGHHPQASAAYLLIYLLLMVMAGTGLALAAIDLNSGPLYTLLGHDVLSKAWFRQPHEWLHYVFMGFVVVHLAMLILHEGRHGIPVAQAMVSGYQYLDKK